MSSTIIFNKVLTVSKIQDNDKRKCDINITIEEDMHSIKKEVILRLTDEKDEFFWFQLKITEEDFQILKAQQELLIDFKAFPQMVIQYLENCQQRNAFEASKFSLLFNLSGGGPSSVGHLSVVQSNEFKQLKLLQLEFHPGTDGEVKNYLLSNLKTIKYKLEQMTNSYNKVDLELKMCRESLTSKVNEINNERTNKEERMKELERLHEQKLNDQQQRNKDEMKDLQERHALALKRVEQKVSDLTENLQSLKETKSRQDVQIADLKSHLSSLEEEKRAIQSECTRIKKEAGAMEKKLTDREVQLSEVVTRMNMTDKEINVKDELLMKERDQLHLERESKRRTEEEAEHLRKEVASEKDKMRKVVDKLKKTHLDFVHFKEENKELQAKLDRRTHVSFKQEEVITSLKKDVDELRKLMESLRMENSNKSDQARRVEEENKRLREELERCRKTLSENDKTISFLSKQLNENQVYHLKDYSHKTPPSGPNSRNIGNFIDIRNNNNNNNSRPLTCEDLIDPKYLRSSLDEMPGEVDQPGKPMSPSLPLSNGPQHLNGPSRISPATKNLAQYSGVPRQSQPPVQPNLPRWGIGSTKTISPRQPVNRASAPLPLLNAYFPKSSG